MNITTTVVDQVAGSLSKYIEPSLKGKSFDEIMRVTKKKVVKKLKSP